MKQYKVYHRVEFSFVLLTIIFICKFIILLGLIIIVFFDQWTINPRSSRLIAGYRKRCLGHARCLLNYRDPLWMLHLACFFASVNFFLELINIIFSTCCIDRASKFKIALEGIVYLITFALINCLIGFAIFLAVNTSDLPINYTHCWFIVSLGFTLVDWACSLRRLVTNWPETIYLPNQQYSLHSYSMRSSSP